MLSSQRSNYILLHQLFTDSRLPVFSTLPTPFAQVFRQNKRATDVHDIIGFRVIVFPQRARATRAGATASTTGERKAEREGDTPATNGGGASSEIGEQEHVHATPRGHSSNENRPTRGKEGGSKPARAVFTVKTFPPPYRDADSRLLHDVYEVLIGLFDEVPGRFKVGSNRTFAARGKESLSRVRSRSRSR